MHCNQPLSKIITALALLSLFIPIASASHLLTGMATHDTPLTTLDIEASVQQFTPSAAITIEGRTKPFAIMHGFVNNVRVRVYNTKADGKFKLLNMPLAEGNNTIKLEAKEGEASVSKEYTVVYDGTPPTITLNQAVPQATQANSLTVSGDVNEKVTIYYRAIHRADQAAPELVSNFKSAKLEANAIELSWDPSTAADLQGYVLERDGKRIAATTLNSFRDEGLRTNTPYTYALSAFDASCNTGAESTVTATTKPGGANATPQAPPSVNLSCETPYQTATAGSPFSITLALIAGFNDVEIIFEDQAGNQEIIQQTVLMDGAGPKFLDTNLEELSPSYIPDIKVKGKLDEKATVFVYVNDETSPSAFEVTDDDGTFSISVRLRTDVRIKKAKGAVTAEAGEGWANKIRLEAVDLAGNKAKHGPIDVDFLLCGSGTWWQANIGEPLPSILLPRLMIQGVQQIGIPFNITYIGSNQVKLGKVDVRPIPLAAGAAKDFDHDWVTVNEYTKAKGNKSLIGYTQIQFESVDPLPDKPSAGPNERETALSEHRKGECLVPGVGCVKLFLQMEIQFQEIYSVQPADPRMPVSTPKIENRVQRVCMPMDIAIDRTIPSDIIPKGLLKNAVKLTEKAIELIDKILKPLTTIGEYVLYGCLASNVWMYFNFFTEKMSCEGNALLSTATGGAWSKDVAEAGLCETAYSKTDDATKKQKCLTCQKKIESRKKFEMTVMHALCDRIGCPSAPTFSTYIKDQSGEASVIMDAIPDDAPPDLKKWNLNGKIYSGNDCAFTYKDFNFITPKYWQTLGSTPIPGTGASIPTSTYGIRQLHDIAKGRTEPPATGLKLDDCKKYVRPAHPACCGVTYQQEWSSACGVGVVLGSGLDTFDELKQSTCLAAQQANADATDLGCNSLWNSVAGFCEKGTGQASAQVVNMEASWTGGSTPSRGGADGNSAYLFVVPVGAGAQLGPLGSAGIGAGTATQYKVQIGYATRTPEFQKQPEQSRAGKENFRLSDSMTAVFDKDVSHCFGQKPGVRAEAGKKPATEQQAMIDCLHKECVDGAGGFKIAPCDKNGNIKKAVQRVYDITGVPDQQYIVQPNSGFLRSVECACIPAVTSYLQMWRTVLGAFHGCFSKILLTGEGSEGFCAAKMSGVICDLLFEAISCFTQKFSISAGARVGPAGGFSNVLSALTGAGTDVSRGVNQRYGETSLYKSLFSERKLVHAICTWAFTGTWDLDMSWLFQQQVEEIPVDSEGALTTCQRTFISYDPTTSPAGLTTWAYRIAGGIIAGADVNYRLKLKCSAGYTCDPRDYRDGKCDCTTAERTITVNSPELGPGRAGKFDLVNFDAPFLVSAQSAPDSDVRYDTAILEWEWTDPQTKQLRTDKVDCSIRETEGGQPPAFCSLDLFSGKFRCLFGELEHGIKIIDANATKDAFLLNQKLDFGLLIKQKYPEERRLHAQAKKFLTYEIKDSTGRIVEGKIGNELVPLRTTSEAVSAPYALETDGTYRYTAPQAVDSTPLGRFTLNEDTIKRHKSTTAAAILPTQDIWGPSTTNKYVKSISIEDAQLKPSTEKSWLSIYFPTYGADAPGEERYEVHRINAPDANQMPQKGSQGWSRSEGVLAQGQISPQEPLKTITFTMLDSNNKPQTARMQLQHFSHFPGFNQLEILVGYPLPGGQQQASDPCTGDAAKRPSIPWTATFTIYDADKQGNPTDQISTDPETGTPQQRTMTFNVRCINQADADKQAQQPAQTGQATPPAQQQAPPPAQIQLCAAQNGICETGPSCINRQGTIKSGLGQLDCTPENLCCAPIPATECPSQGCPTAPSVATFNAKPAGQILIMKYADGFEIKWQKQENQKWKYIQYRKTPTEDFTNMPDPTDRTPEEIIEAYPAIAEWFFPPPGPQA